MLFSNNGANQSDEPYDMQLNDSSYQYECHKANSISAQRHSQPSEQRCDQNYDRRRRSPPGRCQPATRLHRHQHRRPVAVHTSNAFKTVILLFIVLLASGQLASAHGTHSRDSPNSIYRNYNRNVNNVNNIGSYATITIENATDTDVGVPIVDIDELDGDVSDAAAYNEQDRRSKRAPVYHNEFAVYVPAGAEEADSVAAKHGFTNMGQVRDPPFFGRYPISRAENARPWNMTNGVQMPIITGDGRAFAKSCGLCQRRRRFRRRTIWKWKWCRMYMSAERLHSKNEANALITFLSMCRSHLTQILAISWILIKVFCHNNRHSD